MKHLFQQSAYHDIMERLHTLSPSARRQWGKMDVAQMLAHCSKALEVAQGKIVVKRLFIGRILSPFIKKQYVGPKPFSQNAPTAKDFIITGEHDFSEEKEKLKKLINEFANAGPERVTTHPHAFFGKLTPEEWSISMYKHLDHHFRQFGV